MQLRNYGHSVEHNIFITVAYITKTAYKIPNAENDMQNQKK